MGTGTAASPRPMRADARRNYERLLSAARAAFTEHGADASLDDIAKRAGVGIGTLYRHFATRYDLFEAVLIDRVMVLVAEAHEAADGSEPPLDDLMTWLRAVARHSQTYRGLAAALMIPRADTRRRPAGDTEDSESWKQECHEQMNVAAQVLVSRAQAAGAIRQDITGQQLLRLLYGITLATEAAEDQPAEADRLLTLLMEGVAS